MTVVIVLMLIFSGPAGAVYVGVDIEKTEFNSSDDFVNFTVWVNIESGERIPVQNLTLNITGPTNESCMFYLNGTNISGCSNVTITPISSVGNGSGTLYGYDWNDGYGYNFGSGVGYGYVSGYDTNASAELRYNITWNLTASGADDGSYTATLDVYASGNGTTHTYSSNEATTFSIDRMAPIISNFSVTNIKHNAATINYNTNENTTGKIEYGKTTSYGSEVTITPPKTDHHKRITGLSASTTYHYRIWANDSFNNTNISSDHTFKTDSSPGQSGSVGGGGGGGGMPPAAEIETDSQGDVLTTFTKTSSDGKAQVTIPEGTVALDSEGAPLESITMSSSTIGGTIAAYNLGPDGATFDPGISLTFTFDPKKVHKDRVVIIKMFTGGKWVELETTVDTVSNTATAKVSHFTIFALFTEKKPVTTTPSAVSPTPEPTFIPRPTPTPPSPPPFNWPLLVMSIIGAVIVVLLAYYYRRRNSI